MAVRSHAIATKVLQEWPAPDRVLEVALRIKTWSTRHDVDAAIKLTTDSPQGILFANDRVVSAITASKGKDGGKPRVEVVVELLRTV
jgi:Holliday junction resolvase RusA-like endonuclease